MLQAIFNGNNSITLDSVNQWSLNQMIEVFGLSLNDSFNVSYSHTKLTCDNRCLERLGRMFDDIAIVPVPGILFTEVGTITVQINGNSITIPVQSADKPSDYGFLDDNQDIDQYMVIRNRKQVIANAVEALNNEEIEGMLV